MARLEGKDITLGKVAIRFTANLEGCCKWNFTRSVFSLPPLDISLNYFKSMKCILI